MDWLNSIIDAVAGLFGGGGGDAASAGIGTSDVLRDVGAGTAGGIGADAAGTSASFYPAAATAAGTGASAAGGGSPWWQLAGLSLQGANLGAGMAMGRPEMPKSTMFTSAESPGVDPQAVKTRLSGAQASGLSGASPDFLAQMMGLTPEELTQILGQGNQGATVGRAQ